MKWGNIIYNIIYINIKLGRILKIMAQGIVTDISATLIIILFRFIKFPYDCLYRYQEGTGHSMNLLKFCKILVAQKKKSSSLLNDLGNTTTSLSSESRAIYDTKVVSHI